MNIFVATSMNDEIPNEFFIEAKELLNKLFENNNLVFGACISGIMGVSYKIAKEKNKKIIGINPEAYVKDFTKIVCEKEITTKNLANRLLELEKHSDVILVLPGGYGTVCEFLYMIESKRAGEFDKPIILYNKSGYFNTLIKFIKEMEDKKFAHEKTTSYYKVIDNEDDALNYINLYNKKD